MKRHNINSKGEADHISTRYYIADEVDAELAALTAERDALRSMLKELQWRPSDNAWRDGECPKCLWDQPNHAPDCELAALLKGGEPKCACKKMNVPGVGMVLNATGCPVHSPKKGEA